MLAVTVAILSATAAVHAASTTVSDTTAKSILWVACDDPDSLAAASSWALNITTMQLALADKHGGHGDVSGAEIDDRTLCLTHPGPEVPAGWGPHLVPRPCYPAAAEQRWA